ncbi:F0F1 ATP synthase subunit A [Alloiococcus sp. CFN-8]|uniref:F0F1 ATP synthase subunit A n=1 Tax=Alloiococcus sp. CFN-8 TaxID=3416081 RepID=UPI003CEDDAAF
MFITEHLSEELLEMLNCETVFTIPVLGGIGVSESTVITWFIIAALTIISIALTRNLVVENPGKRQLAIEFAVEWLYSFFDDIIGEHGRKYIPYLMTVIIYLGTANTIGLLGMKPPTKDLSVTLGLAIMSIVLIESATISKSGVKGYFKKKAEPIAIVAPINFLEILIRPLSLCMRLFGNILGAFVVMELIKIIIPVGVPVAFSLYFDIFDALIQAYVFVFLTSLFIKEAIE